MVEETRDKKENRLLKEITTAIASNNLKIVATKFKELRVLGNMNILPSVLELLNSNYSKEIQEEVFLLLCDIKKQSCAEIIVDFIDRNQDKDFLSGILSACWQSSLDYSKRLDTFARCFITGSYAIALESFTVLEESLHNAEIRMINRCYSLLNEAVNSIHEVKRGLYNELLKIIADYRSELDN